MISVTDTSGPALPLAEALRERHGPTRREAEVALLLAEGLKNEEVAERLTALPKAYRISQPVGLPQDEAVRRPPTGFLRLSP